jgi:hypothetical protein
MKNNKMRQQHKGSSFFDPLIRNYGEGFFTRENPLVIRRKMHLLFRDIAFGNIDEKYYKYFVNQEFLNVAYSEAVNKQYMFWFRQAGEIEFMKNYPSCLNDLMKNISNNDIETYNAYTILVNGFQSIMQSGDPRFIDRIVVEIKPYKYKL